MPNTVSSRGDTALVDGELYINGEKVLPITNSLSIVIGFGEVKVETQSAGGGVIIPVFKEDSTSKVGQVNFEVAHLPQNKLFFTRLRNNQEFGVFSEIKIINRESTTVFKVMKFDNDPEWSYSSEGNVPITFKGSPAQTN